MFKYIHTFFLKIVSPIWEYLWTSVDNSSLASITVTFAEKNKPFENPKFSNGKIIFLITSYRLKFGLFYQPFFVKVVEIYKIICFRMQNYYLSLIQHYAPWM